MLWFSHHANRAGGEDAFPSWRANTPSPSRNVRFSQSSHSPLTGPMSALRQKRSLAIIVIHLLMDQTAIQPDFMPHTNAGPQGGLAICTNISLSAETT